MAKAGFITWRLSPHTEVMYSFALKRGAHSNRKRMAFYDLCDKYQTRFKNSPPESMWPFLWKQSDDYKE